MPRLAALRQPIINKEKPMKSVTRLIATLKVLSIAWGDYNKRNLVRR